MKKMIGILLASLSMTCFAQSQIVPIVWPFSTGAQQANFIRVIIDEANRQQNKYTFIYENKPGAGGAVAARYVQEHRSLAILSSSSSFFVRPQFYPGESHRVEDFKPVLIECTGQPYAITSVKYKTLAELQKQKKLTIGLILGSLTEAMGRQLQTILPDTELTFVGYQGTIQPLQDMLNGTLDLNVDLPSSSKQWVDLGKLNIIGSSGTHEYKNFPTFAGRGVRGFEGLVSNYQMVVKSDLSAEITQELHDILRKAAKNSNRLPELMASDSCKQEDMDLRHSSDIYNRWVKYWPEKLRTLQKNQ